MFTRNWYVAQSKTCAGINTVKDYDFVNVNGGGATGGSWSAGSIVNLGGTTDSNYVPAISKLRTSYTSYGGVVLGTGNVEPTLNDYKLSGDIITDYTYSCSVKSNSTADGTEIVATYTVTNNQSSAIIIKEIGIICGVSATSSGSKAEYKVLYERTVLDSPVTIEAGGVGIVTYTIRMNYPTA